MRKGIQTFGFFAWEWPLGSQAVLYAELLSGQHFHLCQRTLTFHNNYLFYYCFYYFYFFSWLTGSVLDGINVTPLIGLSKEMIQGENEHRVDWIRFGRVHVCLLQFCISLHLLIFHHLKITNIWLVGQYLFKSYSTYDQCTLLTFSGSDKNFLFHFYNPCDLMCFWYYLSFSIPFYTINSNLLTQECNVNYLHVQLLV